MTAGLPWLSPDVLEPCVRREWLRPAGGAGADGSPVPAYRWAGAPSLFTAHLPAMLGVLARVSGGSATDQAALLPCLLLGGIGGHPNALAPYAAKGAARAARPAVASAVIPDLGSEAARELRADAPLTLMGIPAACLDVVWPAFDDYVASLPGQRRLSCRRERAALAAGGCEVTVRELGACAGVIAPLLARGLHRHGHAVETRAASGTLERLAAAAGPAALAFVVERSRRVLGACVTLRHGDELHAWRIGIADCEAARAAAVYFNLGYYAPIEHAIRSGVRRVHFGVGNLEPKLLRGCRVEPRWHVWVQAPAGGRARTAADLWNRIQVARLRDLCDRLRPAAWPAALG